LSVYKDHQRSRFYRYDFEIDGHRFFGKTKKTTKREAETVEAEKREEAKRTLKLMRAAATSLALDHIAGRYWSEIGQHHAGARNTERQIAYLIDFFGKDRLLTDITGDDVAKLVAWRRGHSRRDGRLISAYTVNDVTEQLRKIFVRAKTWGVRFDREPIWREHFLAEPQERIRELVGDEHQRLQAATRDDYTAFFAFAHASGLRLNECLLTWSEVDWGARQIRKAGKGGRPVTVPITPTIRQILWPLQGHHPEAVFTYVAVRSIDKIVKGRPYRFVAGQRYPMTLSGVDTAWKRLRKRAGVTGFRFHYFRHDVGTKILRKTGNLKLVQRVLNHRSIKSTLRYAHVLNEEIADAIEDRLSPNQPPDFAVGRNLKDRSA
jgi:integrase